MGPTLLRSQHIVRVSERLTLVWENIENLIIDLMKSDCHILLLLIMNHVLSFYINFI